MFALLLRPNRGQKRWERRLGFEMLENRDCPAALTLESVVLPGHEIQLSGSVIGDFAPGSTINFDGAVSGTCEVNSTGQFFFSTLSGSLGTVSAVGMFDSAAFTDPATTLVATPPPSIDLAIASQDMTTITISGKLTSIDAAGQWIPVPGFVPYAITDAEGNFTFTVTKAQTTTVSVSVTDLWGQPSNVAQIDLTNVVSVNKSLVNVVAPLVIELTAVQGPDPCTWTFQGYVYGTNVANLTVSFGELLSGETATVDQNGWYTFTKTFNEPPIGAVTAWVTADGITSNTATWIF